ncbi:MAG: ABC transporter substrate-binding protein [Alphaproteobacteria bacterium]|nr:ABC transporter substrate-binding protein [Alphaproteobacteria bacterium]
MLRAAMLAAALLPVPGASQARDLVLGRSSEHQALDPHFSQTGTNNMTAMHVFERLIAFDVDNQVRPALAESWRVVDPTTWEFTLRAGVRFHDGSPVTPEDVAFSFERVKNIPNSPASYAHAVTYVAGVDVIDARTFRVRTTAPTPQLVEQVGLVFILPKRLAEGSTLADFNSGRLMVGTGPYRFQEAVPGSHVVYAANAEYWGGRPAFDKVTLKFLPNNAARVAALVSGQVDVIDGVTPNDVPTLEARKDVKVFGTASTRLIYVGLDHERDQSPFITDAAGAPLDRNPLKDLRVRIALSKMVNRQVIVERLLSGAGVPAGQIVPEGLGGYDPGLKPAAFDPDGAKRLLAEAGYPNGFGLTLHSSNDRFANDGALAQALGQMFTRGGLKVNGVVALPYNVYAAEATARKYSAFVFTFGTGTSNSAAGLRNVLGTFDRATGQGALNRMRYSNPSFDAALKAALGEFDEGRRNAMLAGAARIAFGDVAVVPVYFQKVYWAAREGISYEANKSEDTLAMFATPVK